MVGRTSEISSERGMKPVLVELALGEAGRPKKTLAVEGVFEVHSPQEFRRLTTFPVVY